MAKAVAILHGFSRVTAVFVLRILEFVG